MSTRTRPPFRRRNFFVKGGFQARFAVYPIGMLALFLVVAGLYLHWHLGEVLRLQLYLPHSRLQDPWQVVAPVLPRVAAAGGAAFLLALGAWVWRRFARLRRDLERLADWLRRLARGESPGALPALSDPEVAVLGQGLRGAAQAFQAWDAEVQAKGEVLLRAVERAREREGDGRADLEALRGAWADLRTAVTAVRVEADLS